MKLLVIGLLLLQFGPRAPLTPAETLLEPAVLKAINEEPSSGVPVMLTGSDQGAGDILITCTPGKCGTATQAAQTLQSLVNARRLPQPARSIRITSAVDPVTISRVRATIHVAESTERPLQIIRGLWSTAGLGDEVVEVFSTHHPSIVEMRPYENVGQLPVEGYGVSTTTIVANTAMSNQHAAFVAAASAYFLATLPNAGAEAMLSHLTVGAHARLAEDGR